MNNQIILLIAGFLGGSGVILGALGAHALKKIFTEEQLVSYEVAVRYQIYHALLLLWLSSNSLIRLDLKTWVSFLVILGILMFSGSIYLLNISQSFSVNLSFLWPVTPLGGVVLIMSWFLIAVSFCFN